MKTASKEIEKAIKELYMAYDNLLDKLTAPEDVMPILAKMLAFTYND